MTPNDDPGWHGNRSNVRGACSRVPSTANRLSEDFQMRSKESVATVLLMLCVVEPAHALQLTSDPAALSLRHGTEATAQVTVGNDQPYMRCAAVEAGVSDERIAVTPRRLSLCVGAKGTATLPVALRILSNAEPGGYFVEIILRGDGVAASHVIYLVVDREGGDEVAQ